MISRRRALAVVLSLALVTGACGDDDDDATVGPGEDTTTTVGDSPTGTTGPGDTPDDGGSGSPATVDETTIPPAATHTDGPPGSAAPFYLRPSPATSIVLEVSAHDGAEPAPETIDHVANIIIGASGKGVRVVSGGELPSHETWTGADIRDAADAAATVDHGDQAVMRLLFVHGTSADSDSALGVAVRGDTAAIFSDLVAEARSPLVGRGAIEAAVTAHEVGHLLGLVDTYLDTGRDDPEHPGHSTNRRSVMYWAVESSLVSDLLSGGPPRDFDAADLADLAAIRDGA